MAMSYHDSFHLKDLDQLRSEIGRQSLDIPVSADVAVLGDPLKIGSRIVPNRFCVQPIEGYDAEPDGSPGGLTFRRYMRYAAGGFGLIWIEATAVMQEARSNQAQLFLHKKNLLAFSELVKSARLQARNSFGRDVVVMLQLAHSGRYSRPDGVPAPVLVHHNPELDSAHDISADFPLVTDEYLDRLRDVYISTAGLAAEAGFDGVDIKSCHNDMPSELLAAFTRTGRYGGSFENRTRFLRETVAAVRCEFPELIVASRLSVYDTASYPYGFGADREDHHKQDLSEPLKLIELLRQDGISLLNVSVGSQYFRSNLGARFDVPEDLTVLGQNALEAIRDVVSITSKIQNAYPSLPVVACGSSWLRQFMPHVAAGLISKGDATLVGVGRGALAYPDLVKDVLLSGAMDPVKCCVTCSACTQLMRDAGKVGCVLKDSDIYGPEYRHQMRFAFDHVKEEAKRCHYCEAASCMEGCPAHIDIPAFIKAFAEDNLEKAYAIIRQSNVLPEMCSHLCPAWMMCEGRCIETILSGNPIPIHDIQYVVSWLARTKGLTKVNVPEQRSGKNVAIVGGGPGGTACAIGLIEKGHRVVIMERDARLGGTPESVIRGSRFSDAHTEIEAALNIAVDDGTLEIQYGREMGRDFDFDGLRAGYDAVLLAAGVWQEASIGQAKGVIDAITFLKKVKSGELTTVPSRVAILSGGDCAMDAAVAAKELGALDIYVVYEGALSQMHWHLDDGWFRTSGAHCMTLTRPMGYEVDGSGCLTGLKICRIAQSNPDADGSRALVSVKGTESVLGVDMVIEAMGLSIQDEFKKSLSGVAFTDGGLIRTVGDDSFFTGVEKIFAVGGLVNGGAAVVQCIAEGMKAAEEIDVFLAHLGAGQ